MHIIHVNNIIAYLVVIGLASFVSSRYVKVLPDGILEVDGKYNVTYEGNLTILPDGYILNKIKDDSNNSLEWEDLSKELDKKEEHVKEELEELKEIEREEIKGLKKKKISKRQIFDYSKTYSDENESEPLTEENERNKEGSSYSDENESEPLKGENERNKEEKEKAKLYFDEDDLFEEHGRKKVEKEEDDEPKKQELYKEVERERAVLNENKRNEIDQLHKEYKKKKEALKQEDKIKSEELQKAMEEVKRKIEKFDEKEIKNMRLLDEEEDDQRNHISDIYEAKRAELPEEDKIAKEKLEKEEEEVARKREEFNERDKKKIALIDEAENIQVHDMLFNYQDRRDQLEKEGDIGRVEMEKEVNEVQSKIMKLREEKMRKIALLDEAEKNQRDHIVYKYQEKIDKLEKEIKKQKFEKENEEFTFGKKRDHIEAENEKKIKKLNSAKERELNGLGTTEEYGNEYLKDSQDAS